MAAPINLPVNAQLQNQTQLQRQIQQATQNLRINFATGNTARSLGALSQPLGRLTGQADEFTKSLDAANARVLAFGASVGVVNTLSNAFKSLVASTIEVEKAITAISVVGDQFAGKNKQLSQGLFTIAKATGQSFQEVSKAALEFSRQGLSLEQTLQRTQDALVLTRLTGLDAAKSVDGLTASVNAFSKAGLSTTQIINKLAAVDQAFAVSSADLIEGFNRSAAVAQNAGVTFDELAGIITALQQETSRGGAVIGNALKTIFTRLQDTSTLNQLKGLGVAVQDLEGNLLPARQILQNLAKDVEGLGQITRAGIFKDVAGTFQINQLISLVSDLNKENSVAAAATKKAAGATNEAFVANEKLNQSLDAIINKVTLTGKQIGALLGEIGLADNLKGILDGINSFLEGASNLLQGDDLGSRFAKGIVKGIGSVLTGPGIGLFLAIIAKLSFDLAKFGVQSLKTFFGIGQAAKQQQQVQESIVQTLIRNQSVLSQILNTQGGQNAQAQAFLNILKQEEQVLQNIRTIASGIAAPLVQQGYRAGAQGIQRRSAGGYLPAQEAADVRRGVGGASPSSKVVAIPNFAFGGGKRGTMIANTSEYIVPNYAGGGSAIFNQDMVKTMGLPPGAKKITASGGFIPNFAAVKDIAKYNPRVKTNLKLSSASDQRLSPFDSVNLMGNKFAQQQIDKIPKESALQYENRVIKKLGYKPNDLLKYQGSSAVDGYRVSGGKIDLLEVKSGDWNSYEVLNKFLRALPENYGTNNILDVWSKRRDSFSVRASVVSPIGKEFKPTQKKLFKRASGGFIPNFANYIYDSDRLPSGSKDSILNAILDSTKKKNLLVGPSGAGKSTYAAGLGTFISSLDDLSKASSFTILSAAAQSSKGGFSDKFANILAAVNSSGGKTSYLGVPNAEIMARRSSRSGDMGDIRSAAALAGTANAPLNQSSFIKSLGKSSKNFEMIRESKSNQDLAVLGLYGKNGTINGSPVYTLQSQRPNLFKDIKGNLQKNVTKLVQGYASRIAKSIGIPVVPKDIKKSLGQLPSTAGFMFEDVLNQLAGPDFDSNRISGGSRADFPLNANLRQIFGASGGQKFAEVKLNPYTTDAVASIIEKQAALAGGAQGPQEISSGLVGGLKSKWLAYKTLPGRTKGRSENKAVFNEIVRALGLNPTTQRDTLVGQIDRSLGTAAGGYIPNFASALLDAISREKSAGLSESQIYVDKSPALKSASNPMGLMVANRRDEPAGGFQGIARARMEGMNPKTYGAARGFVPNYAPLAPLRDVNAADLGSSRLISKQDLANFNTALKAIAQELKKGKITLQEAEVQIDNLSKNASSSGLAQKKLNSAAKNLITAYDGEIKSRKQQAKDLRKARADLKANANNNEPTGQFADLAGKLVVAQAGISFFTGALENAGGKTEQFGTAITDIIGKFTQLIFVLQSFGGGQKLLSKITEGFSGLFKKAGNTVGAGRLAGLGGRIAGGVTAAAGPLAIAAGAAYLINGVGESIKDLFIKSGTSESLEELSQSAQSASASLTETTKANTRAAISLSNQFEGNLLATLQQVAGEISSFGLRDYVQKGNQIYTDANVKEDDFNKFFDQIVTSFAATGIAPQEALAKTQQLLTSQKIGVEAGVIKTDITQKESKKVIREQLERNLIIAAGVKANEDFAVSQALVEEKTKASINYLKNNADSIKSLTLNLKILKDIGKDIEIGLIFEKSINKSLIDLNSSLSESERGFEEFKNTIKDINLDSVAEKSKNLTQALSDISDNALQKLNGAFAQLSKDAGPAIAEIQKSFSELVESNDIKGFEDTFVKILRENNLGDLGGTAEEIITKARKLREQTEEIDRQTAIKKVQAQLDFSAKTLVDQKTLAEERLTQALEKRTKTLEQNYSIDQEILKIRREIEDTQFERSLIGLSESAKLSRQRTRADTVERRRGEEDVINSFRETVAGAIANLASEIPNNLSFEAKQGIRGRIFDAQQKALTQNLTGKTAEQNLAQLQVSGQVELDAIAKEIQEAEKKASDLAFENAKLTTDIFDAAIQSSALSFASIIEQSAYAFQRANLEQKIKDTKDTIKDFSGTDSGTDLGRAGQIVSLAKETLKNLEDQLKNLGESPQLVAQRAALATKINELEKQRTALQGQAAQGQQDLNAAMAAGNQLTGQRSLADMQLTASGEKATTAVLSLTESLGAMTNIAQILSNKIRDYFEGLPGEIAGLQFSALQSTSPDDLASNLIQQDVLLKNKGQEKENVESIAAQTALRQKSFELATAESASRRRELEIELQYLEEFFSLKQRTADLSEEDRIAELAALKRRQIEEQRTFGAGLGRGFAQVQTDVDNFKSQLGEKIPQLFSDNLAQGLNDAISGAKSLKDALRDAATSFFQEITRENISNLAKSFTSGINNVAKGFFPQERASGGLISGGSGVKDDVPAMLMGGEYVIKKSAVKKYGSNFLDALNKGSIKGFASGGGVQSGAGGSMSLAIMAKALFAAKATY